MISPEGLSVPALLDAAAEQDREAAIADELAAAFVTETPRLTRPAAPA